MRRIVGFVHPVLSIAFSSDGTLAWLNYTDDSGDSHIAYVFRVPAAKVLAFAKAPHAQTTFRFEDR